MKELENKGINFDGDAAESVARQAANDLWLVFCADPDRNSLALMSEAPLGFNPITGKMGL